MDALTLALSLQTVIAADAAVADFCRVRYGTRPTIYVGVDEADPPPADSYPLVAVYDFLIAGGGTSASHITYDISMACGVMNRSVQRDDGAKTIFYTGLIEAELLRDLVFSALRTGHFGKLTMKDGNSGQAMAYPLFVSGMVVSIETPNLRTRP